MHSMPSRLRSNGRSADQTFDQDEFFYHGFTEEDWDEKGNLIKAASIRFPDFSVNRGKYSEPGDVRYRVNGQPSDGCYGFTVKESRHENTATPVHDPLEDNYAHTEIRLLLENEVAGEDIPPKRRKPPRGRAKKLKRSVYRKNLAKTLKVIFPPGARPY